MQGKRESKPDGLVSGLVVRAADEQRRLRNGTTRHRGALRRALELAARDAGLFCFRVGERGHVQLVDGVQLEHGPRASADVVATIACRELVKDRGQAGEELVRAEVASRGVKYAEVRT
jgi:hypothetical protein